MKLDISQFYISSICENAKILSKDFGFGIESTEFSYALNMDEYYNMTKNKIDEYYKITNNMIFHAPFYELSMGAIDAKCTDITNERLNQFYDLCKSYKPKKLVFHSGFLPNVYYKEWFIDKCISFLNKFIINKDITICLENVFSDDSSFIYDIVSNVANNRLKICLDIGHINAYAKKIDGLDSNEIIKIWIDRLYQYIDHLHIHNNYGLKDTHSDVYNGNIDIKSVIEYMCTKNDKVTYTIEVMNMKDFPEFINKLCEK